MKGLIERIKLEVSAEAREIPVPRVAKNNKTGADEGTGLAVA